MKNFALLFSITPKKHIQKCRSSSIIVNIALSQLLFSFQLFDDHAHRLHFYLRILFYLHFNRMISMQVYSMFDSADWLIAKQLVNDLRHPRLKFESNEWKKNLISIFFSFVDHNYFYFRIFILKLAMRFDDVHNNCDGVVFSALFSSIPFVCAFISKYSLSQFAEWESYITMIFSFNTDLKSGIDLLLVKV